MKDDPIYFWISDGSAWIRLSGDACSLNSTRVKEFGRDAIRRGIRQIMVDMEECSAVDSTFMGTLTGLALRLYEIGEGKVRLLNTHPEIRKQFEALGLDQLFSF
ncbi:MAG: STAS domain-containing protein [Chthoniobacteraceae bacterium]